MNSCSYSGLFKKKQKASQDAFWNYCSINNLICICQTPMRQGKF